MSKIKLTGDTSGYVEISAPNVAANNTLELGGGTKILTNLDNVFTGVTTYSGNIDLNANLDLDDNNKILLGTGDDIEIFHNGTDSFVRDVGTGSLYIDSTSGEVVLRVNDTENAVVCRQNAEVELYHNGSQKFETTTTGATVTGTLVSGSVTSELDLTAISSSISDTAVDVFVYDTRKDSDGGAWRKRTQNTSWYNETLNTSTRGSRKEFPAVAVIVVNQSYVSIYDGDDPDLPLWMRFNQSTTGLGAMVGYTSFTIGSAVMVNGILMVGLDASNQGNVAGLRLINFITEQFSWKANNSSRNSSQHWPIEDRNGGRSVGYNDGNYIVSEVVNDVAATVLPNAPVDSATGLPVPTIAVATDGGVSVIKDDGSVVDINRTSDDDVHHVALDGDRVIMFMELGAIYVATIPGADQSGNPNSAWTVYGSYGGNTSGTDHPAVQAYGAGVDLVSMKDHTFATAGYNQSDNQYKGLSILSENVNSSGNGMVAWAHTDFNTGYMHGDIKGAFLSDTDATNITSGEILSNGDFTNGTTGWTLQDAGEGSISSSSNQLTLNNSTSTDPPVACYQQISLEVGKYYNVESNRASGLDVVVNITTGTSNGGGTGGYGNVIIHTSNGNKGATFLATHATMYCYIRVNTNATGTAVMNSVSIRKAEEDRSINNAFLRDRVSALTINGTITKSAVATGADLVAYSGWSNGSGGNYLKNTSSTYNFGSSTTSALCIIGWFKHTSVSQYQYIGSVHNSSVSAGAVGLALNVSNGYPYVYDGNSTSTSSTAYNDGKWHCAVGIIAGGLRKIYVDGNDILTDNRTVYPDMSSVDTLAVGHYCDEPNIQFSFSGSLSLVRFSNTIPSPEQIKKIYEDEKLLFQENAKATLYGSSDAVTALAYDEDTELLHVGTSSGRSDFQGLRRINNTTTAVTTAISASDDLIAEQ